MARQWGRRRAYSPFTRNRPNPPCLHPIVVWGRGTGVLDGPLAARNHAHRTPPFTRLLRASYLKGLGVARQRREEAHQKASDGLWVDHPRCARLRKTGVGNTRKKGKAET